MPGHKPPRAGLHGIVGFLFIVGVVVASPTQSRAADTPFAEILRSIVKVHAVIPGDARTAHSLGTEREGNGVVIGDDGLVLTIGYLILEASAVQVTVGTGEPSPAEIVAYDHATGFGLIHAPSLAGVKPLPLGRSADLAKGVRALAVSAEGTSRRSPVTPVAVVSRREFAGYWEYLLDSAIYTRPYHDSYGGAALLDSEGALVGIGSLFVNDAETGDEAAPGNLFVPIDLLKPILGELVEKGRSSAPANPWLGLYAGEAQGRVFVRRVARGGPAETAGVKPGDIIIGVGGCRVAGLADFYRKIWSRGAAGIEVGVDILPIGSKDLAIENVSIRSLDRHNWLKLRRQQ